MQKLPNFSSKNSTPWKRRGKEEKGSD